MRVAHESWERPGAVAATQTHTNVIPRECKWPAAWWPGQANRVWCVSQCGVAVHMAVGTGSSHGNWYREGTEALSGWPGSDDIHPAEAHNISTLCTHCNQCSFPERALVGAHCYPSVLLQVCPTRTPAHDGSNEHICGRCVHVEELRNSCLVTELWDEMSKLRSIREYGREIDYWNHFLASLRQA